MSNTRNILVIDDDKAIQEFLRMALTDEGFNVVSALDGVTGLQKANEFPLSLILLDMTMPNMDGGQFIQAYKQAVSQPAPVVIVTARQKKPALSELGAAGFIPKPFDLDNLIATVQKFATE
jgi:DNA-binding response OmpR family regulator